MRNSELRSRVHCATAENNLPRQEAIHCRKRVNCICCTFLYLKKIIRQRTDLQSLMAKYSPCLYTFDASPQAAYLVCRSRLPPRSLLRFARCPPDTRNLGRCFASRGVHWTPATRSALLPAAKVSTGDPRPIIPNSAFRIPNSSASPLFLPQISNPSCNVAESIV